ncbi:ribonuclease III [bacterium]|nr:ribonuclease III [bacterium]
MSDLVNNLENIFGIKIKDESLFKKALTHPSNSAISADETYERLEFLGDSVLKLLSSDILYNMFPEFPEGKLSKIRSVIVSDATLAEIFKSLKLQKYLILDKHDNKQHLRENDTVCACAFEALLGAYYLEGHQKKLRTFLKKQLSPHIDEVEKNYIKFNAKALLQEYTQSINKQLPVYELADETGPAHKKTFTVNVYFRGELCGTGSGLSKKEAEQNAAAAACEKFEVREEQ